MADPGNGLRNIVDEFRRMCERKKLMIMERSETEMREKEGMKLKKHYMQMIQC